MAKGILVFAEQRDGALRKSGLEALSEGRRIADARSLPLTAALVGAKVEPLAAALAELGADRVLVVEDPRLALYVPGAYAAAVQACAKAADPEIVLLAASAMGKDLGPRAAARLGVSIAPDATKIEMGSDGAVRVTRPVYAGKAFVTLAGKTGSVQVVSLRPNNFAMGEKRPGRTCPVEKLAVAFEDKDFRAKVTSVQQTVSGTVDLTEAEIVVSGGRGLKGPENFPIVQALADALGGAMGASRAAVDAGWIDHQYQVGQTGKVVSPNLYIAAGISGAIQHLAGMTSSKVIVAINKDADAPIFNLADYGIVGDLFEVLPALTEEVKKLKASGS
jgi:electron transfer flavoprotein alpha subunit